MADNKIANAIKFLKGEEKSLPATKTEGQVYFAYKNVGTAEKPSYTGAIYIDTPIGGTQNRIKMTANADIADKAFNDSAGLSIRETYLSSLGYTDDGKQTILIKGSGNNQTRIALPIASTTKSGIVSTDAQSFNGTKTFTTINSTNLTVTGFNGFNYSSIGAGIADVARPVWFADSSGNGKPVINTNFTYNPATQTLSVANLSGIADKANKDNAGNDIRSTYISNITVNNDIMTITKGSGATSTLSIKDKLYSGDRITAKDDLDNFIEANVFKFGHIDGIEGYNGLEKNDGIILSASWDSSTNYGHQIFIDDNGYALRHRYRNNGNWSDWASILDSTTYNSYAPTKAGGGAYGTWDINILGNAASATKAINDDGGQNIRSTYVKYKSIKFNATADKVYLLEGNGAGSVTATSGSNISTAIIPAATDKAAGVITAAAQTFSGDKTFNNSIIVNDCLVSKAIIGTDKSRFIILPRVPYSLIDSTHNTSTYFKALLKWICANYPNKKDYSFIGLANPNNESNVLIHIYDTGAINAEGYPEYSTGLFKYLGGALCTFGTVNYNYYCRDTLMTNDKYAGSASSGGAAISANKLNTNAGSATRPVYFSGGVPVQCNDTLANSISGSAYRLFIGPPENKAAGGLYMFQRTSDTNFCPTDDWWSILRTQHPGYDNGYWQEMAYNFHNDRICFRRNINGTKTPWKDIAFTDSDITGKSASTDALNWTHGNGIRFTKPNYTEPQTLHIAWAWADGSQVKLISEYRFNGGDGHLTQVSASQFNGNLNGNANTATALTSSAGSSTQPIYFSGGKPVACAYTLSKSVPADAKFTDTDTWRPLGTTADTACAGNDSRLSNARPASDVYSWAKASTKPTYSWGEITGKPSTFTPSSHEHTYLVGSYTKNGGQQNPNYFGLNKVGFLMMNTTVNGNSSYKDWLIMDCYGGNDAGGGVAFGVNRQKLGAYIMRSDASRKAWAEGAELLHTANYTEYTVTKSGSGASGTWGINVTGSAGSVAWGNVSGKPSSFTPASHTHPYLPLSGGTMTGTINFTTNKLACMFGGSTSAYYSGVMHQNFGNEAIVFAATNSVTSFIFKCGQNPTSMANNTWANITPSMQIKQQSVYINSLIANGVTPSYNLYVNGTTRCNGTLGVGNGSNAQIDFFSNSSSTIGARIKAYNDRIEFVFS